MENVPRQVSDQPRVLGRGQELVRSEEATGWMLPANERLDAADLAALECELGLVVHGQLPRLERMSQLAHEREAER